MRRILALVAALILPMAACYDGPPSPTIPAPVASSTTVTGAASANPTGTEPPTRTPTPVHTGTPAATPEPRPIVRDETAQSIRERAEAAQPDVTPWLPPQAAYVINGIPGGHIFLMGVTEADTVRRLFAGTAAVEPATPSTAQ